MEQTDEQLMAEYVAGKASALPALIERYLKPIYNFTYRLSGNADAASDITQEVFIKVWKYRHKFKPEYRFKTWLFTIARNTTIDWLRKKRPVLFSELDARSSDEAPAFADTIADEAPLADELFTNQEHAEAATKLLNTLPAHDQEIILLRHQQELSFEEIAKVLARPLNTVKSQYRRALLALRHLQTTSGMHQNKP